jgi:hypothetical protein
MLGVVILRQLGSCGSGTPLEANRGQRLVTNGHCTCFITLASIGATVSRKIASLLMVLMLREDVDFGGNPEDGDVISLLWWLLVVFEEVCWVFCCWVCRVYFSAAARTVF